MTEAPLLCARNLSVRFPVDGGTLTAVDGVDLDIARGEVVAIVGESGSGKSMLLLSLARLVPPPGRMGADRLTFEGRELTAMRAAELRRLRGHRIGFVFQNPLSSLNPLLPVGEQIAETTRVHLGLSRAAAQDRAAELLDRVGIPAPRSRMADYPHQFSGGMRQRVMIAMAISCDPALILADEPTTALDVTIQAQILDLLRGIVADTGTAIILVTHDLGIAANLCDRVLVMYAGQLVESADVAAIFAAPRMPYTWGLLDSIPRFDLPPGGDLPMIGGNPPNPLSPPPGCRFVPRCAVAEARCRADPPPLSARAPRHAARCWATEPDGWLVPA
jgi:oligopeptide/dipeptide ABC transporter ATP-binding protein